MYNPERHHRRSVRLKGYDYSQVGSYFVTICIQNRECILGEVLQDRVILSNIGEIVHQAWLDLPKRFSGLLVEPFVIMPNHVHGIVSISQRETSAKAVIGTAKASPTLGEIVRTFKALSTRMVRRGGAEAFSWQRNYYERIIRNEEEWERICHYIAENPKKWAIDRENPNSTAPEEGEPW